MADKSNAARKRAIEYGVDAAMQRIARGGSRRPMALAGFETPYTRRRLDRYRACDVCGKLRGSARQLLEVADRLCPKEGA